MHSREAAFMIRRAFFPSAVKQCKEMSSLHCGECLAARRLACKCAASTEQPDAWLSIFKGYCFIHSFSREDFSFAAYKQVMDIGKLFVRRIDCCKELCNFFGGKIAQKR